MVDSIVVHQLNAGPHGRPPAGSRVEVEWEGYDHVSPLGNNHSVIIFKPATNKAPLDVVETVAQVNALWAGAAPAAPPGDD